MIDKIDSVVNAIGGFLYQPYIVPLFLIVAGLYFTIRTGLIQFRLFGESIHVVAEKPKEKGSISSFGALMVSTASRVGTGNIVGVSTAICLGGFGAVFWMWVVALLGGASAFIESALAQVYKKKDGKGGCVGGPSYYMEQALHQRWLGVIFAVVLILTYVVGYNMLASYNLQDAFAGFGFYAKGRTPYIIGAILAVLFAACVLGGGKRLTNITGVLVPVMGVLYILVSLVVIFMNIKIFPSVIANIFRDAFNFKAAFSGFAGSCIMWGIKRGLYSNEAGMGSAPNAAATADVSHPAKQGLVQMLSVFIDTLLICSATAFMCLCSGVEPTKEAAGAAYVQASMQQALGSFGPIFIAVSMSLFAFTTLIGNYYYCEGCLKYILRRDPSKAGMTVFRLAATALVFVGAIVSAGLAWDTADMLQGTMVIINIPVILILSNKGLAVLKDYDFANDPRQAIAFQRELEARTYAAGRPAGEYAAPAENIQSFLEGRGQLKISRVQPTYDRGVCPADLGALLPGELADTLRAGLRAYERKIAGYTAPEAILTGLETRTSSPVRLKREENFECAQLAGLYPCGEGAGYAGGIMSAAVDGLRVARAIISRYSPAEG